MKDSSHRPNTYLSILGQGHVAQAFGSWVHNVKKLHDGGTIVGNEAGQSSPSTKKERAAAACRQAEQHLIVVDQLVHPAGPQRRGHGIDNRHAGIDIADELRFALARVGALLQQDHLLQIVGKSMVRYKRGWARGEHEAG
eukprot:1155966-Pelagomonas_calceolata.AAC.2